MNEKQWTYSELKAHYIAVRKRLGGLGKSAGLVPITVAPVIEPPAPEPEPLPPKSKWEIDSIPNNAFKRYLIFWAWKKDIDPNVLISQNRRKEIAPLRHNFFYDAYRDLDYSQSQIARFMNRDHTTVNNSIKLWEEKIRVSA